MEAVLFIGIQGSGKTTFYKQAFFDTHVRINLDMLKTRRREKLLVEACIEAKQRFVVDNTNVGREERARYIERLQGTGFQVTAYFFEPKVERAIRWNEQRSGKAVVPLKGLLGTLKRLERPSHKEGFHSLYRVTVDRAQAFVVSEWKP